MRGSCLCGEVTFEISGSVTPIEFCHCPRCRKAYGSTCAATLYVAAETFRWARGEDRVQVYDAPIRERPPAYRHVFCRSCGSPLPIVNLQVGYAEIPAGSLEGDPGCRPLRHIFVGRKAAWHEISDDLPTHPEHVPPSEHLLVELLETKRET